ncbi:MAG: DNA-binding NarL/FixJ family response regulator [Saprospiraceae bacterium]|jgi:DNA-binding NarL/FixJ family response regulator
MYSSATITTTARNTNITPREQEIVDMLSEGFTVKEIATLLYISTYTVESHKRNLMEKFGAKNTVHMVVRALGKKNQSLHFH